MKKVLSEEERKRRNGKLVIWGLVVLLIGLIVYGLIDTDYHSYHRIRENEPRIFGEVIEIEEKRFLLRLHPASRRYDEYTEVWVSLKVKTRAGDDSVSVGNAVEVYYDGNVSRNEAEEPWVETVYMLLDEGDAVAYFERYYSEYPYPFIEK